MSTINRLVTAVRVASQGCGKKGPVAEVAYKIGIIRFSVLL
jgi:hypothetical protein